MLEESYVQRIGSQSEQLILRDITSSRKTGILKRFRTLLKFLVRLLSLVSPILIPEILQQISAEVQNSIILWYGLSYGVI